MLDFLPDALCLCLCWLAVLFDQRSRRIPNRLTYSGAVTGVVLNVSVAFSHAHDAHAALDALASSLAGAGLLLVVFGFGSALGLLGFGDTKLACAVGACVRLPLALRVLPCIALAGGLVAIVHALATRRATAVAKNLARAHELVDQRVDEPARDLHLFPYALAIALGTTWAVTARYVPALSVF